MSTDVIIIISIFVVTILSAIGIIVALKHSEKKGHIMINKREPKNISLKINPEYITKKELAFLKALHKALPSDFIAFPKVSLAFLLMPDKERISYNLVSGLFVDICVFVRDTMEPVLVIDLLEQEPSTLSFKEMEKLAKKALQTVNLSVIDIKVQGEYDIIELRKQILNKLPDKVILMLKENLNK